MQDERLLGWVFEARLGASQAEAVRLALATVRTLLSGELSLLFDLVVDGTIPRGGFDPESRLRASKEAVSSFVALADRLSGGPFRERAKGLMRSPERLDVFGRVEGEAAEAARRGGGVIRLDGTDAPWVVEALDLYSRLAMGQVDEIAQAVIVDYVLVSPGGRLSAEALEDLRDAGNRLRRAVGWGSGYLGIGAAGVVAGAKRAWEVKKVLEREVAMAADPDPAFRTVAYDGLVLSYTGEPRPSCRALSPDPSPSP